MKRLEIGRPFVAADDLAVQRKFHDIVRFDQFRAARARQEKSVGPRRMADADMAASIDDLLMGQNAIGDDEIVDRLFEALHGLVPPFFLSYCWRGPGTIAALSGA